MRDRKRGAIRRAWRRGLAVAGRLPTVQTLDLRIVGIGGCRNPPELSGALRWVSMFCPGAERFNRTRLD